MEQINYGIYYGQVSCIDRQIAELQARRNALLSGTCYTGVYYDTRTYLDPYNLDEEEWEDERDSNETERYNKWHSENCGRDKFLEKKGVRPWVGTNQR